MVVDTVYVVHTTSTQSGSDTDDSFVLLVPATGKVDPVDGVFRLPFPKQPHDNREQGRTDYYEFDISGRGVDHREARGKFAIETKGKDGWRPSSIWITGRLRDGRYRLLGAAPRWPASQVFSRQSGEGRPSWVIPAQV